MEFRFPQIKLPTLENFAVFVTTLYRNFASIFQLQFALTWLRVTGLWKSWPLDMKLASSNFPTTCHSAINRGTLPDILCLFYVKKILNKGEQAFSK